MQNKIAEYRKLKNITQQELADIVDVTRQTIIALEQNKYNPSLQLAYKIKEALNAKVIEDIFIFENK